MPEYCTCGTKLVENARFCHRCGRPTSEEKVPEPAVETDPVSARLSGRLPVAPVPVSFKNPIAVRVAFLMLVGIMLVDMIPDAILLTPLWWLAAGWGAVRLYRRLTGFALSVKEGARIGAITGVMTFLSFTLLAAFLVFARGKEAFEQVAKQNPQLAPALNDPVQLAAGVLMFLCLVFGFVVGICAAGGALGARFASGPGAKSSPVG